MDEVTKGQTIAETDQDKPCIFIIVILAVVACFFIITTLLLAVTILRQKGKANLKKNVNLLYPYSFLLDIGRGFFFQKIKLRNLNRLEKCNYFCRFHN